MKAYLLRTVTTFAVRNNYLVLLASLRRRNQLVCEIYTFKLATIFYSNSDLNMGDHDFDVAVVGACMVDMFVYVSDFPKIGETLRGSHFKMGQGGKGGNQCVVANKLGAKTAMVAMLGNDYYGRKYREDLSYAGINVDHVRISQNTHSGVAVVTVTDRGENSIVTVEGANELVAVEHVENAFEKLRGAKVVVFQLEIPVSTTVAALKLLRQEGNGTTILNAAPAIPSLPEEIFGLCDVFCVNESEAEILSGMLVSNVGSATEAVKYFKQVGCHTVIITLGGNGVIYQEGDDPCVHVPARKITPVDTTGAGDAFVGALAFYVAHHPELPFKIKVARSVFIATESVLKKGAQASYPTRKDLPENLFK